MAFESFGSDSAVPHDINEKSSSVLRADAHLTEALPAISRPAEPPTDDNDARAAYYTNLRADMLINDVEKLPPGADISSMGTFLKMMFTTEKLDSGANPFDDEKGVYALASKLGAGIHARTCITENIFDDDSPYSLNIDWHGKTESFPFA